MEKPNVLYLTRNGLLEPLGQSQILAYLKPLSAHYRFHIVSFEKERDLNNTDHYNHIAAVCRDHNISWTPLTYGSAIRGLGVLTGFFQLFRTGLGIQRQLQVSMIHARSYYPAFVALAIRRLTGTPFLFDMRALWAEELVVAGRLKPGTIPHRMVKDLEKRCLIASGAVISLTQAAANHLIATYPNAHLQQKMVVIPTCTDTDRFATKGPIPPSPDREIVLSCFGALLSGWFKIGVLAAVIDYLLREHPNVRIAILTRDDEEEVHSHLDPDRKYANRISIGSAPFAEMPQRMQAYHGTMFFYEADISRLGSFPTRMGESLSVGLPVLCNPCVSDVRTIVEQHGVGVILEEYTPAAIKTACDAFLQLLEEPDIVSRCRNVAEEFFSLESGVARYAASYQTVLSSTTPS